jgi:hypothetical protein
MPPPKVLAFWAIILGLGLLVGRGYLGTGIWLFLIPLGLWVWVNNNLEKSGY